MKVVSMCRLLTKWLELLFGRLVMLLNRHRYTSDSLPPTSSETLLDKLITRLAASLKGPFALDKFL